MKKILFLIHDLGHGGAEKVLVNLVNYLDPEKFENKDAVTPLIQKREAVIRKMLAERSKILKNDRRAKELHEKILNLNKELAVLMENKRAIRDLTRELQQIDKQINAMPLKKKNQITTKQGNKK